VGHLEVGIYSQKDKRESGICQKHTFEGSQEQILKVIFCKTFQNNVELPHRRYFRRLLQTCFWRDFPTHYRLIYPQGGIVPMSFLHIINVIFRLKYSSCHVPSFCHENVFIQTTMRPVTSCWLTSSFVSFSIHA